MKTILLIMAIATALHIQSQSTQINKSYPANGINEINMDFDYPELIKVSSWDGNEIKITGSVNINGGEGNDHFSITDVHGGGKLSIKAEIRDIHSLSNHVTVIKDGKKMTFKNKEEFRKYKKDNQIDFDMTSWGNDMNIVLEVKVPRGIVTNIHSTYGTVELRDINQSKALTAKSTYGGVDAELNTASVGELLASTNYGQIYTNLGLTFSGEGLKQADFHTEIKAHPGHGPRYEFESQYGNVYLRKK